MEGPTPSESELFVRRIWIGRPRQRVFPEKYDRDTRFRLQPHRLVSSRQASKQRTLILITAISQGFPHHLLVLAPIIIIIINHHHQKRTSHVSYEVIPVAIL